MSFVSVLSPASILPYLLWRARGRTRAARLRFRAGPLVRFRPLTRTANDYGVAYEIFVFRYYACPRPVAPEAVRCIVDLGANVGFTPLYWAATYPNAEVIAYEPHPAHVAQLRFNLALNPGARRIELHPAAAGARAGRLLLSDEGMSSAELPAGATGTTGATGAAAIDVPVEDCLAEMAGRRIDILKIDIEGGEYAIMRDPRFATLDVGRIVMEWHRLDGGRDRQWCEDRLRGIGYTVEPLFDAGSHGMLWAFRG